MRHKRHYTLEEALRVLDEIKDELYEMLEYKGLLNHMGFDIYKHSYLGGMGPNGTGKFPEQAELLIGILKRLSQREIMVKDMDEVIIDFPAINSKGEEVYLCYKIPESTISYWHKLDEGFINRKHITDL